MPPGTPPDPHWATQARPAPGDVALGVPPGTPPDPHWLQGLLPFLGGRPAFDTQQQQPFATQQQQLFATQQQQSAFTGGQTVSDPALQAVAAHHGLDAGFHSHAAGFHSLAPERHAVHAVPPNAPPAKYVPHTALPPPQYAAALALLRRWLALRQRDRSGALRRAANARPCCCN